MSRKNAFLGYVVASLAGQWVGNLVVGKDWLKACNYSAYAAMSAGVGGVGGNILGKMAGRIFYPPVQQLISGGIEGTVVGTSEASGYWAAEAITSSP